MHLNQSTGNSWGKGFRTCQMSLKSEGTRRSYPAELENCEGQNAEHLSFSFQLLMASFIASITWGVLSWSKASICGAL
jgi:hypothetical protein